MIDLIDTMPEKLIDRHFVEDMANEMMAILHKEIYPLGDPNCFPFSSLHPPTLPKPFSSHPFLLSLHAKNRGYFPACY